MLRRGSSTLVTSLLLVNALAFATACERGSDTQTPDRAPADPASTRAQALAELADAIDPGPIAPMSEDLPDRIEQQIVAAGSLADEDRAALIDETVAAFAGPQSFALLSQPGALLSLAKSIALLEARVAAGQASVEERVALQTLYAALDQPVFAEERGMFGQMIPVFIAAARAEGDAEQLDEVEAFLATLFDRMRRAEPLRRRLVAELLRSAPTHPAIPEVLASIPGNLGRLDPKLALRAAELARELHPNPGPTEHLEVAYRCALVLDLACADAALELVNAKPEALDETTRARLDSMVEDLDAARTAVATATATDLEGRLAHARALFDLTLFDRAKPVYAAVWAEHPTDARALTGLARIETATHIDIAAAGALIQGAGPLDHKDREYYEIAIASRVLLLFNDVVPRVTSGGQTVAAALAQPLVELRGDIEGYRALGSEFAEVLLALLDVGERVVPLLGSDDVKAQAELLRASLDEAVALQARLPLEPHAYTLLLSAAELMPDRAAAEAAALRVPPIEGGSALILRQAQALLNLAIIWQDVALLEAAAERLGMIPPDDHRRAATLTAANVFAVAAGLDGQLGLPDDAVERYYALFQEFQDAGAVNNLAVLLWKQGDIEQAEAGFDSAIALGGDEAIVARVNRLAVEDTPETTAGLEAIANDEQANGSVRRLAMTWLAHRTQGKAKARWEQRRRESLASPTILPNPLDLPNSAGVLLLGKLDFDVAYSIDGLVLTAGVTNTPWLVATPSR